MKYFLRTLAWTNLFLVTAFAHLNTSELHANDWSQFRGPNGNGVSSGLSVSDELSMDQVLWKIDFGRGGSSPIISNGKLFLTSYEGDARTLKCLEASTGKELWSRSLQKLRTETATPPNDPAICTPVCDGETVVAWFPDAGLVAYSLDGKELWKKDMGPHFSMHGISASPVLIHGKLVISVDQLQDAFIVAMDAKSGKEIWRTERLLGVTGGYSTPVAMKIGNTDLIISACPGELLGYDLATGERKFSCTGVTNAPVGLPVIVENRIYYSEPPGEPIPMEALGNVDPNKDGVIELEEVKKSVGAYRLIERIDKGFGNSDGKVDLAEWEKAFGTFLNSGGLCCIELNEQDGKVESKVLWKYTKSTPYIPSVIVLEGIVYVINDGGILISFDAESGDLLKRTRLKQATGQYYSSPISDGQRLLLANIEGKISLVQAGREWKSLSTIDLEEQVIATPAIQNGNLYIRTESQVYCFGMKKG